MANDNYVEINLYKQIGFITTGVIEKVDGETKIEMILSFLKQKFFKW